MNLRPLYSPIEWRNGICFILDQGKLPSEQTMIACSDYREVIRCIKSMAIRGAPALGVAASYAVVLAMKEALRKSPAERKACWDQALIEIASARPTAVNLPWAVKKMQKLISVDEWTENASERLLYEAGKIHRSTQDDNEKIAALGASLFERDGEAITYCNTGGLAAIGIGTAFGVLYEAYRQKRVTHVYACETRPMMQGSRLTVWELHRHEIPYTLICDNMAATVMKSRKISGVVVGADRIAANGDTANKVGTYNLAVLCHYHKVPFYVVAPVSSFDLSVCSGEAIPIEQRSDEEILSALGQNRPPFSVPVYNPAFDVTPHALITAIICEKGIIRPPNEQTVTGLILEYITP